jgi:hypothetical protein
MKKTLICFLCLVSVGLFGQGIPYGREFRVNTYTAGWQSSPTVVALTGGGFVVCWSSYNNNITDSDVYVQVFNESGEKKNSEFMANTYTNDFQYDPGVIALTGGGYVVYWESNGQDGSSIGAYGQVFDEQGEKKNNEFRMNASKNSYQEFPCAAALPGGGFVACWQGYGQDGSGYDIYGQVFDESGEKKNGEFRVNTSMNTYQESPCVSALSGGGFVVCWVSWGPGGPADGMFGQVFDESGQKKDKEFQINPDNSFNPTIANLTSGGFVVCWVSIGQDGSGLDIHGQVFDESGEKKNVEFQINTSTYNNQNDPHVTGLSEGGFVVCWSSHGQDGSDYGVYGQVFDVSGEKKNSEFRVNTYTTNGQRNPSVANFSGGGFIVSWDSDGQDGSGWGVYAKRFPSSPLRHVLKPFILINPANDVTLQTTDTRLEWCQPSNQLICYPWELHYIVFIDDNPDFLSSGIKELDQDTTVAVDCLHPGTTYFWKVLAKNVAGDSLWSTNTNGFFVSQDATSGVEEARPATPEEFKLHQNYPNPFNPETSIRFDLPESGLVVISVLDISGRLVRLLVSESRTAGSYSVQWDGKDQSGYPSPSGIYVCRMEARSAVGRRFTRSVKMGLVR